MIFKEINDRPVRTRVRGNIHRRKPDGDRTRLGDKRDLDRGREIGFGWNRTDI